MQLWRYSGVSRIVTIIYDWGSANIAKSTHPHKNNDNDVSTLVNTDPVLIHLVPTSLSH